MKTLRKLFIVFLITVPNLGFSQDDIINEINIEGINLLGYPKWDISLNAGYAYRFEPIPDGTNSYQQSHLRSLKNGPVFGGSVFYFKSEGLGLGGTFSTFSANSQMELPPGFNNHHVKDETLLTDFYGASVFFRQSNYDENFYFGPVLGLGYMRYLQKIDAIDKNYNREEADFSDFQDYNKKEYNGGAIAMQIGLRSQKKITKQLAIGFKLDMFMGITSTRGYWQIRKENNAQREGLSRIEIGLSLHYLSY